MDALGKFGEHSEAGVASSNSYASPMLPKLPAYTSKNFGKQFFTLSMNQFFNLFRALISLKGNVKAKKYALITRKP